MMKVAEILSILDQSNGKREMTPPKPPAFRSTITPEKDALQGQAGVNLGRIISDHGSVEIDELTAKIERLRYDLEDLEMEREFIQALVTVTEQYRERVTAIQLARANKVAS